MQYPINFIEPDWDAPVQIKAYTTLRHAWGKHHPVHSRETNDRSLEQLLKLPTRPIWIKQTHSTALVEATPENKECIADASFTTQPQRVCAVLTADCLPILLCNRAATIVAAIHAGWRGLANGIIENTLNTLQQPATDWFAWLGPAIGPKRFEIGIDVYQAFTRAHSESNIGFSPLSKGKWLADLYTLAKLRLITLGITRIYGGQYCTYSQENLFYSYRRDKGQTGRMASVIWINQ